MISIIFYTLGTTLVLFFLGFGLTLILIPERLRPHAFWLTPWFTIIFLILFLTISSLAGLPVRQAAPSAVVVLVFLTLLAFFKLKLRYRINLREEILIGLFILISIIFNLSPLVRSEKFLTSVSFGNNDVSVYAITGDHLVNHSIVETIFASQKEGFLIQLGNIGIGNVLFHGYRWGTAIVTAFFLNIFQLEGYQLVYLLQVILFAISVPLIYILFKILYKPTIYGLILILAIAGFNTNLLYMLYHNFFGQVLFGGLGVMLLIFFAGFLFSAEEGKKTITNHDVLIGATFGVLYFSYHEVAFFILAPLALLLILRMLLKKSPLLYFRFLIKILFLTLLVSSFSIINATNVDLLQAGNIDQPIGWQQFRSNLPYANPFEMVGFYSIHSFEPMPLLAAIFLSLVVVGIIIYGFKKSHQKLFLASYLVIYLVFLIWAGILHHNFWAYNRGITYSLPIFLVLFSIGATNLFEKKEALGKVFLIVMVGLVLFSSLKLNKRMLREYLPVDKPLVSLTELANNKNINEPIYTQDVLMGETLIWPRIWTEYFLFPEKSVISLSNFHHFNNFLPDGSLVLISKSQTRYLLHPPPKVLLTEVVWENNYYKLGRICHTDECLLRQKGEFVNIKFGDSEAEDSLLISGWSVKEQNQRWVEGKGASLRFKNNTDNYSTIVIEAQTLKEPQKIQVYFDGIYIDETNIWADWSTHRFFVGKGIPAGVHKVTFKFSNSYRPKDVLSGNQDTRNLSVNFARVKME